MLFAEQMVGRKGTPPSSSILVGDVVAEMPKVSQIWEVKKGKLAISPDL